MRRRTGLPAVTSGKRITTTSLSGSTACLADVEPRLRDRLALERLDLQRLAGVEETALGLLDVAARAHHVEVLSTAASLTR